MRDVRSAASRWIVLGVFVVGVLAAVRFATRAGGNAPIALEPAPTAEPADAADPLARADHFSGSGELRVTERSPAAPPSLPTRDTATEAPPARQAGWLAGSVLLDDGVPARDISVVVSPPSVEPAASDPRDTERRRLRSSGEFEIERLRPGTYRLEVVGGAPPAVLAELHDLCIHPGEACDDPRLAGIDLRGRLTVFELRVIDASSRPIDGARVVVTGLEPRALRRSDRDGVVRFASVQPSVDLAACAKGYRVWKREAVGPRDVIVLEPAISARVRITPPADAPYVFEHWRLQLVGRSSAHELQLAQALGPFDPASGSADANCGGGVYALPRAGEYKVQLQRAVGGERSGGRRAIEMIVDAIDVRDATTEQCFELELSEKALAILARQREAIPELHATDVLGERQHPR